MGAKTKILCMNSMGIPKYPGYNCTRDDDGFDLCTTTCKCLGGELKPFQLPWIWQPFSYYIIINGWAASTFSEKKGMKKVKNGIANAHTCALGSDIPASKVAGINYFCLNSWFLSNLAALYAFFHAQVTLDQSASSPSNSRDRVV